MAPALALAEVAAAAEAAARVVMTAPPEQACCLPCHDLFTDSMLGCCEPGCQWHTAATCARMLYTGDQQHGLFH